MLKQSSYLMYNTNNKCNSIFWNEWLECIISFYIFSDIFIYNSVYDICYHV